MSIVVNGKQKSFVKEETVSELLKRMHYTFPLIIVKINDQLIKKDQYEKCIIPDNATIKVIHMISGG